MSSRIYIHAVGAIAPNELDTSDAQALPLRDLLKARAITMPRLASRFAQLAVLGAQDCIARLVTPLPRTTRVYLGTGLGDIARTDALYYEVMPPSSQLASPAQFASAGNNMAAFFVAQQAALASRNITVSQDTLSFEQALVLAIDDIKAAACASALVGGVDETTTPREFYARRFPLTQDRRIGEGAAWLAIGSQAANAIGELKLACVVEPFDDDGDAWATRVVHEFISPFSDQAVAVSAKADPYKVKVKGKVKNKVIGAATLLLPGCRLSEQAIERLLSAAPYCQRADYLQDSGYFPTAAGVALFRAMLRQVANALDRTDDAMLWHVNRDDAGRTGLIAIKMHGRQS